MHADPIAYERAVEAQRSASMSPPEPDVISESAWRFAEEQVIADQELQVEFFAECSDEREPWGKYALISAPELFLLMMNPHAGPECKHEACAEFRKRYLEHHKKSVERIANGACHA